MFLVEWSQLHKSCLWLQGREGKERLAFLYSTLPSLPALNHLLSEAPSGRVPFPSNESPTSLHLTISISQCFPTSQDGSRGLGMSSLKPEDAVSDYSTLDEAQMKTLNDWVSSFISFFFFLKLVNFGVSDLGSQRAKPKPSWDFESLELTVPHRWPLLSLIFPTNLWVTWFCRSGCFLHQSE